MSMSMSKRIAIVGAGTAGLHLGLYLQQKGGQSTMFTDKKIEDYPNVRLLNTSPTTRSRSRVSTTSASTTGPTPATSGTTTSSGCRAARSSSTAI